MLPFLQQMARPLGLPLRPGVGASQFRPVLAVRRGPWLALLLLLASWAGASAQSVSVLEWSFGTSAYSANYTLKHAAVSSTTSNLAGYNTVAGAQSGVSGNYTMTAGSFATAAPSLAVTHTGLTPLAGSKGVSTSFTMGNTVVADWTNAAVTFAYTRTSSSPSKVQVSLTWLEGGVYRSWYSSAVATGTAGVANSGTATVPFTVFQPTTTTTLPPPSGTTFFLEIIPSTTSSSSNSIVFDNVKLLVTGLSNTKYSDYSGFVAASSVANSTLKLGTTVAAQLTQVTNATASANTSDDGVTVPSSITPSVPTTMTAAVTNTTGANAYLNAWIDYNRNNAFDAGEQVVTDQVVATGTSNSTLVLNYTPPSTAVSGTAGVRVRLTSAITPGPATALTTVGETEDYVVNILSSACKSPFLNYGVIVRNNFNPTADIEGPIMTQNYTGTTTVNLVKNMVGIPGSTQTVQVGGTVTASGSALTLQYGSLYAPSTAALNARGVNYNGGGSFQTTPAPDFTGTFNNLVSMSAAYGALAANSTVTIPGAPAAVTLNVGTLDANGVAIFSVDGNSLLNNSNVQQIDINLNSTTPTAILINVTGTTVTCSGSGNFVGNMVSATLRPKILWNFYQATSVTSTKSIYGSMLAPNATVSVSGGAIEGSVAANNLTSTVEVHLPVFQGGVCIPTQDFGDWNGSGALTTGTSSTMNSTLRLGATVDAETSVIPSATATADGSDEDGVTVPASLTQGVSGSIPVTVFNNTGSTAYLSAWIDFNGDGTFADTLVSAGGEKITLKSIPSSASLQTINVGFIVPAAASAGTQRGVRFRLTNQAVTAPTGVVGTGEVEDYVVTINAFPAGSVVAGNLLWKDTNGDGMYVPNGVDGVASTADDELGVAGVNVQIQDNTTGTAVMTVTTDASGNWVAGPLTSGTTYRAFIAPTYFQSGGALFGLGPVGNTTTTSWDDNVVARDNTVATTSQTVNGVYSQPFSVVAGSGPLNSTTGTIGESGVGFAMDDVVPGDANGNMTLDLGFAPATCSIGNLVWNDVNNNGLYDTGEVGLANVLMELRVGATTIGTTSTNASGFYRFTGVVPGTYSVRVSPTNFYMPSGPLAKMVSSTGQDTGSTVDNNDNGGNVNYLNVSCLAFSIGYGTAPVNAGTETGLGFADDDVDGDSSGNMTVDFGLRANTAGGCVAGNIMPNPGFETNTFISTVTAATNAAPISITTSALHGLFTGDVVTIAGIVGNTAANGTYTITNTGGTTFTLNGTTGNGTYTSGGTVTRSYSLWPGTGGTQAYDLPKGAGPIGGWTYPADNTGTGTPTKLVKAGSISLPDATTTGSYLIWQPQGSDIVGLCSSGSTVNTSNVYQTAVWVAAFNPASPVNSTSEVRLEFESQGVASTDAITAPVNILGYSSGGTMVSHNIASGAGDTARGVKWTISSCSPLATDGTAWAAGKALDYASLNWQLVWVQWQPNYDSIITLLGQTQAPTAGGVFFDNVNMECSTFTKYLSVGNSVFTDVDGNGTYTAGEGVPNAKLQLYNASNTLLARTCTDSSGRYMFSGLPAGTYYVKIPASEFASGFPLFNKLSMAPSAPTDIASLDDNVVGGDNGIDDASPATNGIKSNNLALTAGSQPGGSTETGLDKDADGSGVDSENNTNLTIDFGFSAPPVDYGDWNGSGAATTSTYSSVNSNLRLGATIDADATVVPDAGATADGADEDSVTLPSSIAQNTSYTIPVSVFNNTGANAYLNAWIDLNADGTFNDTVLSGANGGERLSAPITVASSASQQTINVTFIVPAAASVGAQRGVRFRLTNQATTPPTGAVGSGEVEDYVAGITAPLLGVGNLVWLDANDNGRYDVGEGVNGVTVQLLDAASAVVTSTTTDALGVYHLATTTAGTYYLKIPSSEFGAGKPLNGKFSVLGSGNDNGRDDIYDENGIDDAAPATNGIRTATFSLGIGTEPTDATEIGQGGNWDNGTNGAPLDANCDLTMDFTFTGCNQTNVLVNGSFEVANPSTLVLANKFPNTTTGPAISYNSFTSYFDKVANWYVDAGAYVSYQAQATEGSRFLYFANSSVCIAQFVNVGASTATGSVVPGNSYTFSADWAPFDYTQPNGNAAVNAGAMMELYWVDPTGVQQDSLIANMSHFYDPATNDVAQTPRPLSSWSNLTWRKMRAQIVLPPPPPGRTQLRMWITATNNGTILVDNVAITPTCTPQMCSVGNIVFLDSNRNGILDAGEVGIDDVYISVVKRQPDGSDIWVADTKTHDGGQYFFSGLVPGNYYLYIDSGNFASTGAWWVSDQIGRLNGMVSSPGNFDPTVAASAAVDDSDKGVDDVDPVNNGISSPIFALTLGACPTTGGSAGDKENGVFKDLDAVSDSNGNLTIDFAFGPTTDFGDWSGTGALTTTTTSVVNSNLRLGATVDAEFSVAPNLTATSDGADEDGVVMPSALIAGASTTIPVSVFNNTGSNAYLNAWVDFNNNGTFSDTLLAGTNGGERLNAAIVVPSSATMQTVNVTFTVPTNASAGTQRGVRFRLTNVALTAPTGVVGSGEVEDYVISILNCPTITLTPATMALATVSTAYSQTLTASGGTAPYVWTLTSGTLPAGLSLTTAGVVSGTPTATNGTGTALTFKAADANGCFSTISYTLKVCPVITVTPASITIGAVGTAYSQTLTAAGGAGPYTWTLASGTLPPGLTLSSGGVISGTPTSTISQTFTVQAADASGCPGTKSYTLAPTCPAMTLSPSTAVPGTVSTAYAQTLTATGGTAPYTWAVSSGTLPAGLTLTTAGVLSGTPTTSNGAGVALTFRATDNNGCIGTMNWTLKICPVITLSPTTLTAATIGTAFSNTITAAGGATPYAYTVSSGTLPAGLTLTTAGVLSGTPTSTTSQTFTVQALDANGCPGTRSYTLAPVCPTLTLTPATIATGTVGTAYSQTLSAASGVSPYAWTLQTGTLPAGLSLSTGGVISGTPTTANGAGTSLTFKAADVNGCLGTITYTLKICPVITVTPATIATGTVGTAYSQTIAASGGTTPYSFAVTSGSLPAGLTIASGTGIISGTPTTANGTGTSITVTATDANGCTGLLTYNLQVCPVITISTASLPAPTVGTAYSQTLAATGGTAPYTWTVSAGTLPTGLTLSTGGVLSGTPTNTTSQTFTVRSADVNGCLGTKSFTLAPACATISITPASIANGTLNLAYTQTLTASGGTAPYAWTLQTGTLPAGLTLSGAGVISGTPTATNGAGTSLTFKATDANACIATATYTLKICPVLTFTPTTLAAATVGTAYSQTIAAAGGTGPYTYVVSSGTLPTGLTLTSAGLLSGTPSAAASQTFTVRATDANSCTGTITYTLAPACSTISLTPASVAVGTVSSAYAQSLSASGGTAPYTWTLTAGTLPGGLSLSTGGVISGTPTTANGAGTALTFKATDVNGCNASITYTLKICPVITVTASTASPLALIQDTASGTLTFTAAGGTAPFTWSVSGTMPTGLTFNPAVTTTTATITGTPTVVQSSTLTVTATDANGCAKAISYSIAVGCPVINITPATLGAYAQYQAITSTNMVATGGRSPYTWSSSGLPAGLTLTTAGVLSGAPTAVPGSYPVTISLTDASGCPGSKAYTIVVGYGIDYGDAPATYGIASHQIVNGVSLGCTIDAESASQFSATANGDDILNTGSANDDDGVYFDSPIIPGTNARIVVSAKGAGYLNIWIDWNRNGVFTDVGEQMVINQNMILDSNGNDVPLGLTIAVPSTASTGSTFVRARFSTVSGLGPTGAATDGEVEDYNVNVVPGATISGKVWKDNNNGIQDGGELGLPGFVVTLYRSDNKAEAITITDSTGAYQFPRLAAGTYYASIDLPNSHTLSPQSQGTNVLVDSNFSPTTFQTASMTIVAGGTTANVDAGVNVPANTISYAVMTPFATTDWTNSYALPKLDPAIGIPTAVQVRGFVNEAQDFLFENKALTAVSYTLNLTNGFTLTLPDASTLATSATYPSSGNLTAQDGCEDYRGTAGQALYDITRLVRRATVNYASPLAFAGTGNITLSGSEVVGFSSSGTGGSSIYSLRTQVASVVAVTYTYKVCTTLAFAPSSLPAATVGTAYSATITASNGVAPYAYSLSSGTLPAGLTLSSAGVLSGTPTSTTSQTFTIQAADANACTSTTSYTLAPTCPAISIAPAALATGTVGTAYSQTLTAASGTAPYAWTLQSGILPAGLTFTAGTGVISGTPTAGNGAGTALTFKATDTYGCTATKTYTLKICPVISITPASLPNGVAGTGYSQTLSASGGTAGYTWSITTGSLPSGLALSAAGVISGTPSGATTGNFTAQAVDANGCPGTKAYSITTTCPTVSITPASIAAGTVGSVYAQTLTATGGTAPYLWTVTSGTLPAGLVLSSGGTISGTPTTSNGAGTSFTVTAADAYNCLATLTYSIKICPIITISPTTLTTPVVGTAFSQTITPSGGATPYTFTVSSGALPAWATLGSTTGVISGTPTGTASATFSITATDVNGCAKAQSYTVAPVCPTISVTPTTLAVGTVGTAYSASVAASGGTAAYTYAITSGTLPAGLIFTTSTGAFSGTPTAATTGTTGVALTISATDSKGCQGVATVNLKICPVITVNPTSLAAAVTGTAYSQTVSATGGTGPYAFTVTSGTLPAWATLNGSTGVIAGTPNSTTAASFTITATDAYLCTGLRAYTVTPTCPTISLAPTALTSGTVGTAYTGTIAASGGTAPYTYAITVGTLPTGLSFSTATGQVSGTPTAATTGTTGVALTIRATDASGCQVTQVVNLKICPVLTFAPASLAAGTVGTAYSQTITASGGAAAYTYAVTSGTLPAGLSMTTGGVISGTPSTAVSSNITVTATDANGCTGSIAYTLAVSCPVINITPATILSGTVGSAYSQTLSATGGTAPYTWVVTAGTLPAGVTLSTAGVLSGTPTTSNGAGTSITVRATDNLGCLATATYNFKICPVLAFTPSSLANGTLGLGYSQTVTASNGATPYTYSVSSGTLPGGLTLNAATGVISGTPTASNGAGTSITLQAVDANTCPGTKVYSIKICPVVTLSPGTLAGSSVGTAYSQTITASGGAIPYTYSVSSGALPSWATLNASTGVISGTPNSMTSATFSITATDVNGCPGTLSYTIAPSCPTLTITPATIPAGTVGVAYSQALSATGGTSPYAWTVTAGVLPAGLTLTSAGVLSGTPTASNGAGVSLTVQAADNLGCLATKTYTLKICPVITVAPATLTAPTVGIAYSQTFTASGGAAAYTYSVTSGALPSWATLNATTGVISGTPNSTTSATFTISAADANGCPGTRSYTIAPVCPTVSVSPGTLAQATVGTTYSATISASGGTSPYTFAITSANLPAGLTLTAATGVISGTPTAATTGTTGVALAVKATDSLGCVGNLTINFKVCPVITVNPATLPAGSIGTAYSQTITATGSTATPYTFTVTSGTLPAGLTLNSTTGVLGGTPTTSVSANISITATDANGCTGLRAYTLATSCPVISITPATVNTATVGVAYSQTLTASGGTAPYTWTVTSGTLPAGLVLSSAGVISGTPSASNGAGVSVTVQASDSFGCVATKVYTIKVCPVISLTPATLPAGTVGSAYSQTVTASGSAATPLTYAVTTGTLPAGLSLNASTGAITGTPTTANGAGTGVTITATDANACTGVATYTVKICPVLSFTPASLAGGTVGTAYSQTVTASGGATPYTYALTSGTLPAGLTFATGTGVISGTPTASNGAGTSLTFTATDANGCPGLVTYSLKICPVITVTPSSLANGTLGIGYTQTVVASGGVAPYNYTLSSGTLPAGLSIASSTGVISGTPTASNGAGASISVTATDANSCPVIKPYTLKICPVITVNPASLPNSSVGTAYSQTITASGGATPYTFTITSGALPVWATLNSTTGVISGTPNSTASATFTVTATDVNGCPGARSYTVGSSCPVIAVSPSTLSLGTVGTVYSATVSASGGTAPYTYVVTAGTLPAGLSLSTAGALTGTPTVATSGISGTSITVTATDAMGCSGAQSMTLKVCPVITITPASMGSGFVGTSYNQTLTATGGTAAYAWSIVSGTLPTGLSLSTTGVISGTPTAAVTARAFTVQVLDANACVATKAYTLTAFCPTVTVSPVSPLAGGTVGSAYSATLSASGGSSPYTFAVTSGTLPTGLTLTSAGALAGTPTVATSGTTGASFTVSATDQYGCVGARAYNLKVCPVITVAGSPPAGTIGVAYSTTFTASGSSSTPYTYSVTSGTLPAGLTLNASTGVVSGTPTATVSASITMTAADANGCTGSAPFTIAVGCPTITMNPAALTVGTVGTAYSLTLTASGGASPYVWTLSAGTLPAGLSLTTAGVLSGTPTAATSGVNGTSVTIQATDANGCVLTKAYNLKICPVITITPATIANGTVGVAYNQGLSAAGGATPYTWTVTSGTLPTGLSLNSTTGLISGTPTVSNGAGVSITVTATDVNVCVGAKTYTIKICPVITLSPATMPAATVGTAYSQTVTASGGATPYTYSVSSGALPAWATLNASTGVISGTPNTTTSASFTLLATDVNGCSGSLSYTIAPACPTVTINTATLPDGFVNASYSQTLAASGGIAPYSWTITAGTVPAGLTLSTAGVLSGTPSLVGTSNFTVRASDVNGCAVTKALTVIIRSLKVGNLVWADTNNNGLKDTGELGIANVTVELWSAGVNGSEENGSGDDVKITTDVVTNASGAYQFVDVVPGSGYYLRIPSPPAANAVTGGTPVTLDNGVDNDNNGKQSASGSPVRSPLFALTGGAEPALAVDGDDTDGDMTIDFGLAPTLSVGNLVFKDINHNGFYDPGIDVVVDAVTLYLFVSGADPLSATPVAATTSAGGGVYRFSVLAGSYFVHIPPAMFAPGAPLDGTAPTLAATGNLDDNGDQNLLPTSKPYALGCNTNTFTLALGTEPTSAGGETGYQSTGDDSYDTNSDLTVDLGLYPIPPSAAAAITVRAGLGNLLVSAISGKVLKDLSGQGDLSEANAPLAGVELALYADANGDGRLGTNEMTAVATTHSDANGVYAFSNVQNGDYLITQSILPGAVATFDSDGGDAAMTSISVAGASVVEVDFLQMLGPDSFAQWQQQHSDAANGPSDNPDGDLYNNLLAYALGLDGSGPSHFSLSSASTGVVDAIVTRPATGHGDLAYQLEGSDDLASWSKLNLVPGVTPTADGAETVRYPNIPSAFVRLKVVLDADHDGTPESFAVSPVLGWHVQEQAAASQTFSMPLLKPEVFAGKAVGATGSHLVSGQQYYAEVISGADEGRRFEIDEALSTASAVAYKSASPSPSARIAIRAHWTLGELFPANLFHAGSTAASADQVMFFDGAAYKVVWLQARPTGSRWVREGDTSLADAAGLVVGPASGVMVHPRQASVKLTLLGQVRSWKFAAPLHAGAQLVGSGYPVALSPLDLGMVGSAGFQAASDASQADGVRVWSGDAAQGVATYESYFYQSGSALGSFWSGVGGENASTSKIFSPFRATYLISTDGNPGWIEPSPVTP